MKGILRPYANYRKPKKTTLHFETFDEEGLEAAVTETNSATDVSPTNSVQ